MNKAVVAIVCVAFFLGCAPTARQQQLQREREARAQKHDARMDAMKEDMETREKVRVLKPAVREALRAGDCSAVPQAEETIRLIHTFNSREAGMSFYRVNVDARQLVKDCELANPVSGRAVLDRLSEERDEIDRRSFYHHEAFSHARKRVGSKLELYIGRRFGEKPYLRLMARYGGESWLFADSFTIATADQRYDFRAPFKRDNYTSVWETADISVDARTLAAVRALIRNGGTVRFRGKKGDRDYTLTRMDRVGLDDVLRAYRVLGGSAPVPAAR